MCGMALGLCMYTCVGRIQGYMCAHVWDGFRVMCVHMCGWLQGYVGAHVWDGFRVMCVHMCGTASGLCIRTCLRGLCTRTSMRWLRQGYVPSHV